MILKADCIIWDEAVMAHKHMFMAVELTVRDLLSTNDPSKDKIPFGGIKILFGGDFRQILPIVKKGNRSAIVNASIKFAPFWSKVKQHQLVENMRIKSAAINQGSDVNQLSSFADFLLSIGENVSPT